MAEHKQVKQSGETSQQAITQKKAPERSGPVLQDNRPSSSVLPVQRKPNNTGLPDNLKSGMENLSGMSLDHVKVHYNSPKPATVQAHAYAQGSDIHLASGQEKHLPHELGHVVQQMQGKVQATTSVGGVAVNDNPGLEKEADVMGARALQMKNTGSGGAILQDNRLSISVLPIQRRTEIKHYTKNVGYIDEVNSQQTGIVGQKMEAWLDPVDPIPGSATGSPQKQLFDAVKRHTATPMVRGHLLNHDLGGYGIAENLYPITSSANSKHKYKVENWVSHELNQVKTSNTDQYNRGYRGIYYEVTVNPIADSANNIAINSAKFECKASYLTDLQQHGSGGDEFLNINISSNPQPNGNENRSDATGEFKNDTNLPSGKKVVVDGWEHSSRRGNTGDLPAGKISISSENNVATQVSSSPEDTEVSITELKEALHESKEGYLECQELLRFNHIIWQTNPTTELGKEFNKKFKEYIALLQDLKVRFTRRGTHIESSEDEVENNYEKIIQFDNYFNDAMSQLLDYRQNVGQSDSDGEE